MKRIKISKKHVGRIGITLGMLAAIVGVTYLCLTVLHQSEEISFQQKQLDRFKVDLASLNAHNGTTLGTCLDNAAKDYDNALKSTGTIQDNPNGTHTFINSYSDYTKANDKLTADRASCNSQYK